MSDRPHSQTLGDLLDELADKNGDAEAIIWRNYRLTYRAWRDRANELGRALLTFGINPGDRVALLAPNRPEWLIAAFAIAKVGAITTAISTFSTSRELLWTLNHSGAKALITVGSTRGREFLRIIRESCRNLNDSAPGAITSETLPSLRTVIAIDEESKGGIIGWNDAIGPNARATDIDLTTAQNAVSPEKVCYILYTSGSTAEPKGVMLSHGPVISNGFDIGERQCLTAADRLWFAVPLFWSFGSANALPAVITHGGCLVLQESFEAGEALSLIEHEGCTVFYGMTNMARALRDHHEWSATKVASMRTGLTIGLPEDIAFIIETTTATELCNVYGSTETYGNASVCNSNDPLDLRLTTQGLPLPGMRIRAVDPETRVPLPIGSVGELAVAGYVTPGYFEAPEMTGSAFSDGYFLTGDLGMVGEDGRVRFHGRLKEMIKTGGVNVAPLEVEAILAQHPAVKQAHVIGVSDKVKGEIVVAVIELKADSLVDETVLRAHCRTELASYKVPARIAFKTAKEFPRTPTGKIYKPGLQEEFAQN